MVRIPVLLKKQANKYQPNRDDELEKNAADERKNIKMEERTRVMVTRHQEWLIRQEKEQVGEKV